ncbi:unnamed protein product [Acanthoscelides obtectus]|uniref:Uncharacterized protein n=1 Tax=Acanthoscelides obtectus TaxID=200917 RepID=A0A9P0K1W6_ACAOB|nr:unnamed protein product [Acanthoscelides obtectus]CAK1647217.1 hypothetical protein AOBTE_LOCUS15114 [Acanthoscelides obtectus]
MSMANHVYGQEWTSLGQVLCHFSWPCNYVCSRGKPNGDPVYNQLIVHECLWLSLAAFLAGHSCPSVNRFGNIVKRRRPGKLQRLPINVYKSAISDEHNQAYKEFSEAITETERILMRSNKRMEIRGKRGRGVPVLISKDEIFFIGARHQFYSAVI